MKRYLILLCTTMCLLLAFCNTKKNSLEKNDHSVQFDPDLAKKWNADQYGMSKYVLAFLKKGPIRNQDSLTVVKLQEAHLANIARLAKEEKLVLAGPFLDDGEFRGIYIFNVETVEEAKSLTETDPAVKAGRLIMELHPWYGSAALKEVNYLHKRISRLKIGD